MATISGSVSNLSSVYSHYVEVYELEQSISENKTKIQINSVLYTSNLLNKFDTVSVKPCQILIDGVKVLDQNLRIDCNPWPANPYVVQSWIGWISHEDDGSKRISVATYVDGTASTYGPNVCTASGYVDLTPIARASSVAATDAVIGSVSSIIISCKNPSFKHMVYYDVANSGWNTIESMTSNTTIPFRVPVEFHDLIPNERSLECRIICETYTEGGNYIGSDDCSFRAYANEELCRPEIFAVAVDENPETVALTGDSSVLVRGFSSIRTTISAVPKYSASITGYQVDYSDDFSLSGAEVLREYSEGVPTTAWIADSRGYGNSSAFTNSVVLYIPLTARVAFTRYSSTGSEGTVSVWGKYFDGAFGAVENALHISYRIKEVGGEYGDPVDVSPTISAGSYKAVFDVSGLNYQKEYVIEVSYSDKLISGAVEHPISQGLPVYSWGKDDFFIHASAKGMVLGLGSASAILSNGDDTNNYLQPGVYGVASTTTAQTIANIPVPYAGLLRVYSGTGTYADMDTTPWTYVLQEYRPLLPEYPTYIRSVHSDGSGTIHYGHWYPMGGEDYIVECGTSGIWTFEKWNSGVAKCCGIAGHTAASTDYETCYVDYPFAFIEKPTVNITADGEGGYAKDLSPYNNTSSTTQAAITYRNLYSNSIYSQFNISVKGRWK